MNRIAFAIVMILCSVMYANADTYTWTDDQGVVSFSDNPDQIPPRYRAKAKKGDDITIRNPKVQQELKEQKERALQENSLPRIAPSPDYIPPPVPPPLEPVMAEPPVPATEGRTKSQRIKDNIERREGEEKTRQLEDTTIPRQ
jgi:Domain of unknown function (DUF4124)